MRSAPVAFLLVAAALLLATPGSAHENECDQTVISCNVENAPPNCVGAWSGTLHRHVGPFSITIHYCKYWASGP